MSDPINEPFLCNDFKKWMEHHGDESFTISPMKSLIGIEVEPKFSCKKIANKMIAEDGDIIEMTKAFHTEGGTIKEVDGKLLMIEVSCGLFILPKNYVEQKL